MNTNNLKNIEESGSMIKNILAFAVIIIILLIAIYMYVCFDDKMNDIKNNLEVQDQLISEEQINIKKEKEELNKYTGEKAICTTCKIDPEAEEILKEMNDENEEKKNNIIKNVSADECNKLCKEGECNYYQYYPSEKKCVKF